MATEEYAIGYQEGYQAGWNAAVEQTPPRNPLTSDEIRAAETEVDPGREDLCGWSFTEGVRWAEKHHGIKGDA